MDGNPAKFIKKRFSDETTARLTKIDFNKSKFKQ